MRADGRKNDEKRDLKITTEYTKYAAGSVLIEMGDTKVLCTATLDEDVPPFLKGKGKGWITAEYSMLPSATKQRNKRDIAKLKQAARSVEIQRLIGRSLRSVVDFEAMGETCITVDCDVIQADGGTRTASITGSFIAMALAMKKLLSEGKIKYFPIQKFLSAISVGIVDDIPMLDLCYSEDSAALVDMNVVMDSDGGFAEIQGTGEGRTFSLNETKTLLTLATKGNNELITAQKEILGDITKLPHYEKIDKILIASNNKGKIEEMKAMLSPLGVEVIAPKDINLNIEVEETGTTFEENAMLKATAFMSVSGLPAIADDSGLSVTALNGEPGIYSARYAGENATDEQLIELLLSNMSSVPDEKRDGYFTSAIAFVAPDGRNFVVTGKCYGKILGKPVGSGGFGYDPIFYYEDLKKSFAQMTSEEKNQVSHRANAIKEFYKRIKNYVK